MTDRERTRKFEAMALPHLDSAYNLARWLMKNDPDAEDAVQQAYLRAFKYFDSFSGNEGRAWILTIVRRVCYDLLAMRKSHSNIIGLIDDRDENRIEEILDSKPDPEAELLHRRDLEQISRLLAAMPSEFREVIVLREIEELSYRQIASVVGVPIGTVMSRLARARTLLRRAYGRERAKEAVHGV